MEKIAVIMEGGLGRVLCGIPALQELDKIADLIVVSSGWSEAYRGSGLRVISRCSPNSLPFLEGRKIIQPEPYWNWGYRNGEITLYEAFVEELIPELGVTVPAPFMPDVLPHLSVYNEVVGTDPRPLVVIQPQGSGGAADSRSMTVSQLVDKLTEYPEDAYQILLVGVDPECDYRGILPNNAQVWSGMSDGCFIKLIHEADIFVGCDSSGIHIRAAAGRPADLVANTTAGIRYNELVSVHAPSGNYETRDVPRL